MPTLKSLGACVLVAASAACAGRGPAPTTATATSATADTREERPTRRQRDVISKEELSDPAIRALSVYDAVKQLRPQYLNQRGSNSIPYTNSDGSDAEKARAKANDPEAGQVHASIDNGSVVSMNELKSMHVNGVIEIRFLNAAAAMQKFGGSAREGPVVLVRTN